MSVNSVEAGRYHETEIDKGRDHPWKARAINLRFLSISVFNYDRRNPYRPRTLSENYLIVF